MSLMLFSPATRALTELSCSLHCASVRIAITSRISRGVNLAAVFAITAAYTRRRHSIRKVNVEACRHNQKATALLIPKLKMSTRKYALRTGATYETPCASGGNTQQISRAPMCDKRFLA